MKPVTDARTPSDARNRDAIAFAVFTIWIVSGLVLDGWSHNHQKPETFFTPWHGLLYSGFLASIAWSMFEGARARRSDDPDIAGYQSVLFDRWSGYGVITFAVGMVGDFLWHQVFGIEVAIDALLSPTHLLLFAGGLMLATSPMRVAARSTTVSGRRSATVAPVLVAAGATSVLTGFFTMYIDGFRGNIAGYVTSVAGRSGVPELRVMLGISTILVTTLVVVVPLLVVVRTVATRPGALTATVTMVGVYLSALDGFARPVGILAAVAAGVAADVAVAFDRSDLVGVVVPLVLWPTWFAGLRATGLMVWNAELWSGSCVLAVLLGGALTALSHLGTTRATTAVPDATEPAATAPSRSPLAATAPSRLP